MKKYNNILFLISLFMLCPCSLFMLSGCGDEQSTKASANTEPEVEEVVERVCDRSAQTGVYTATATPITGTCIMTPFQVGLTNGEVNFGPDCATTTVLSENDCKLDAHIACANSTSDYRVTGDMSVTQTDDDGRVFHGTFDVILEDISVTPTTVICEGDYYFSLLR